MQVVLRIIAAATILWAGAVSIATAQTPTRIRVSWAALPPELVPVIFSKPGLARHLNKSYTFEPIRFASSPLMITGLATGEIDLAPLSSFSFASAILNAKLTDLRVIADQLQDGAEGYGSNGFFVHKDSPVTKVDDLKGKTVAVMGLGSAGDVATRAMLAKSGLQHKRDYTAVEARPQNLVAMLMEKKVDLISGPIALGFDPAIRDNGRLLFTQRDALGKSQLTFFVARRKFIDDNRAALTDFFEDWLRALRWFTDPNNHDEAVRIVAAYTKDPVEKLGTWMFTEKDAYRDPDGLPDLKALQATMDLLSEQGLLTTRLNVAAYVDLSVIEEAAARLGR